MKSLLLLLSFLFLSGCASILQDNSLNGDWEGVGFQDDGSSWTIEVSISDLKHTIAYPSLACGGDLVLISSSQTEMRFREELVYGLSACIDGGETVITKTDANAADFKWYYPDGRRGAIGGLSRE